MDAASLLLYLRDRSRILVLVAAVAIGSVGLLLLAYAVFAGVLMNGPSPDIRFLGPFRWWLDAAVEA